MTKPVLKWSTGPDVRDTTTFYLLSNIFHDNNYKRVKNPNLQYLFVNSFGDIVLEDNTVIVPGASNPTLYTPSYSYYAPNVAFMNSYPIVSTAVNGDFQVSKDSDVGKYIATPGDSKPDASISTEENMFTKDKQPYMIYLINEKDGIANSSMGWFGTTYNAKPTMHLDSVIAVSDGTVQDVFLYNRYHFKGAHDNYVSSAGWSYMAVLNNTVSLGNGKGISQVFPYDKNPSVSDLIVKNMYFAVVKDEKGNDTHPNFRFNLALMTDILKEGNDGSANVNAFIKNCKQSFEKEKEGIYGKLVGLFEDINQSILNATGNVQGVLGIRGAYEDPIFGNALYYISRYLVFILIGLSVFFLGKYIRNYTNWVYTLVCMIMLVAFSFVAIRILPVYIPRLYNAVGDLAVEQMAYSTLMMKEEQFKSPVRVVEGQEVFSNTALSINVYNLTPSDEKAIREQEHINEYDMYTGTPYLIDQTGGMYLQGNSLRYNVGMLFTDYSINEVEESSNATGEVVPHLKLNKRISNNIDYYCPFGPMMEGFIGKLNTFSDIYRVPPSFLYYADNFSRSSFLVNAYINSGLFLTPDHPIQKQGNEEDNEAVLMMIEQLMPNNYDWLGISSWLKEDSPYSDTLWYKTMKSKGYFKEKNKKKLEEAILSTNNETKVFISKIRGQAGLVSDSVLVKTIALYATTQFDVHISEIGDVVYPRQLNYQDISLGDMFTTLLTNDKSKYIAMDAELVPYVSDTYGFLGLILLVPTLVECFLISYIVRWIVPIMYFLLLIVILIRMVLNKEANEAIKGYFKISGVIWACYALFTIFTVYVQNVSGSNIMLLFLIAMYTIILYFLMMMIIILVSNLIDFGNVKFNAFMTKMAHMANLGNKFGNLSANALDIKNKMDFLRDKKKDKKYNKFRRQAPLRDLYHDEYIVDSVMNDQTGDNRINRTRNKRSVKSTMKDRTKYRQTDYTFDDKDI